MRTSDWVLLLGSGLAETIPQSNLADIRILRAMIGVPTCSAGSLRLTFSRSRVTNFPNQSIIVGRKFLSALVPSPQDCLGTEVQCMTIDEIVINNVKTQVPDSDYLST